MDNVDTLRQTASNMRKSGNLSEAIRLYEGLWRDHRASCDQWDGWGYAFSLRKTGNPTLAYQIAQQVHEKWPDFKYNNSVLTWCMYDLFINRSAEEIKPTESEYFGAAAKILQIVEQDEFSPFSRTIFKVIDYLEESRVNYPAENVISWLDRLDKTKLSVKTWTGKDDKGRPLEHASDLERWYAKKCKSLYELSRYQDCVDLGLEALKTISVFHYHNDKWITREIALSYGQLGKSKEAIALYEKVMDERAEWFIYFDLATLYFKNGETAKSLKYAAQAALARQEMGFKVGVYTFLGKVLLDSGELELARRHLLLAAKIRAQKEWKTSSEFQALISQAQVELKEDAIRAEDLERDLVKYWQSLLYADLKQCTGIIKNMVSTGKSGFIVDGDEKEYYFRVSDFRGNPANLKPGTKVSFHIVPRTQPDKLDNAKNLIILK